MVLGWQLDYNPTSVDLRVIASFIPGDYNHNGVVDAADYVVYRDSLGQSGSNLAADGDGDLQVDADDYNVWRSHFGQTAGSGAIIGADPGVPEPSSLGLVIAGILAIYRISLRPWRTSRLNFRSRPCETLLLLLIPSDSLQCRWSPRRLRSPTWPLCMPRSKWPGRVTASSCAKAKWRDARIVFKCQGAERTPITLKAAAPGKTISDWEKFTQHFR